MDTQLLTQLFDTDRTICTLARLYRSEMPSPEEIAQWYAGVDFEALWMDLTCLCARIGAKTGYAGTPAALVPRLKGLSKYILTLNSGAAAVLYALGEVLDRENIPMTLLRDTALALGYPLIPRFPMWHTQAAIPEESMETAARLAKEAGFSVTVKESMLEISRSSRETVLLYPCPAWLSQTRDRAPAPAERFLLPGREAILVDLARELCDILPRKSPRRALHSRLLLACHLLDIGVDLAAAFALAREQGCGAKLQLLLEGAAHLCDDVRFDPMLPESISENLGRTLLQLRQLKSRPNRLHRMWLYARLDTADDPEKAGQAFLRRLRNAAKKRLFS